MTLADLPRNNLKAARSFYLEHGPITPTQLHALLLLQDDPGPLGELSEEWDVLDPEEMLLGEL